MGEISRGGFGGIRPQRNQDAAVQINESLLLWNQEAAILDTTELICELMAEQNINRAELARRMGRSKGFISQLLDGSRNMTIRTVADIFTCLGHEFKASCKAHEARRFLKPICAVTKLIYADDDDGDVSPSYTNSPAIKATIQESFCLGSNAIS